jgi:hypothetical protein
MARRKSRNIPIKSKLYILAEGETEVEYFEQLCRFESIKRNFAGIEIDIYQPHNHSPLGIVQEAKRRLHSQSKHTTLPSDTAWCIFDKDGHANIAQAFDEAHKHNIRLAFSSICFEFWIVLHFEFTTRPFLNCDEATYFITKSNHLPRYKKADKNQIAELLNHIKTACTHAWQLEEHQGVETTKPYERAVYTNVHHLVEFLQRK